jgi:hypothetical protein
MRSVSGTVILATYHFESPLMYQLTHNTAGHALAITRDGRYLLHLDAGTVRNELFSQRVIDVLNAAEKCVSNRAWAGVCDEDVELETAVKALRGE